MGRNDRRGRPRVKGGALGQPHLDIGARRILQCRQLAGARHPRGNLDLPRVGIFAQRGKDRPNRLGLCVCPLLKVEGTTLTVRGLDAIDGTPVVDIKPWMKGFAPRGEVREPEWAAEIMRDYW